MAVDLNTVTVVVSYTVPAILAWFLARKKFESETKLTLNQTATDEVTVVLTAWKALLTPLKDELTLAREEIHQLKVKLAETESKHAKEIETLIRKIRELKKQIEDK